MDTKMTKRVVTHLRIDGPTWDTISRYSEQTGTSLAQVARDALILYAMKLEREGRAGPE